MGGCVCGSAVASTRPASAQGRYPHCLHTLSATYPSCTRAAAGRSWTLRTHRAIRRLATSQNSDRWQAIPFGNRTILLNSGTDSPLRIEADGSITGVHGWTVETGQTLDVADLFNAVPFKNRLIFIEKDSSDLWYGPLNGIQGELKKFPLGGVSPAGGNVLGAGTITLDGGQGPDDLFVVFMSSGAALIYSGTDINQANGFNKVGEFALGRLIGERPLVPFGNDLVAITTDGYVPVLELLRSSRGRTGGYLNLSDTIASAVSRAVGLYGEDFGWQPVLYTDAKWLLFNIPAGQGTVQHVMNTQTRAWCRFRGLAAACWVTHGKRIFLRRLRERQGV